MSNKKKSDNMLLVSFFLFGLLQALRKGAKTTHSQRAVIG